MAPLSFHDRQHLQKVLAQQQNITVVFNRFINAVSPHLRKWADTGKGSVWSRNGAVENVVDRELVRLQAELTNNLSSFQMEAWKRSELKNDQMIREYLEGMSIRSQVKEGLFARNTEGMQALQGRIDKDMNLSTRVWNLADQTKTQLEFYLGSGISTGQSAANISQDIRQILNNPDARFHRIRNAEGKLVESKPMMNYNPGPGVYKSASKNALRVAVTETNMAYRKADHERWKKLDFVLGFEVKRSGNNKGGCAICDAMCGTYPKEFSFTGWHPFCICMATPILMDHDEFAEFLLNDTIPEGRYVTEIPPKAVKCMEQYKYSFMRSPYDMKQNYKMLGNDVSPKGRAQKREVMSLMSKADESGGSIQSLAQKIAANHGAKTTPINYKSYDSILRKLASDKCEVRDIKDAVRTTIIADKECIEKVLKELQDSNSFVRLKRQTPESFMGYSGNIVNVKTKNGITAEIQVNTDRMIYAKEEPMVAKTILGERRWGEINGEVKLAGGLGHKYYEEWRILDPSSVKAKEIAKKMSEYYSHFQ